MRSLKRSSVTPFTLLLSVLKSFRKVMRSRRAFGGAFAFIAIAAAVSLLYVLQVKTLDCGRYFGKRSPSAIVALPFTCSADLGNATVVQFHFGTDQSLTVTKGSAKIFSLPEAAVAYEYAGPLYSSTRVNLRWIRLFDVTYDGYKDLEIADVQGAYQGAWEFFPYEPTTGVFASTSALSVMDPTFDTKNKTITGHSRVDASGGVHTERTYQFRNGAYVQIR